MIKKKENKNELTDHFTYKVMGNIIYIFQSKEDITDEEYNIMHKKVSLIIDDEDIAYINISAKNIDKRKKFYQDKGYILSYYSIEILNKLYKNHDDKKLYRCYAFMTKNDFLNNDNKEEKEEVIYEAVKENTSNKGFISNILLLSGGLIFFVYLCVKGIFMLIK